ncbi:MAG: penicillin-binding protein 2 [Candidatus Omnitrophota bacterium]
MRHRIFVITIFFFFAILIVGLSYTQLFRYDVYTDLSEKNRIRVLSLEAPRGRIFDRNGNLLVNNRLSFDVEVIYQEIKDPGRIADLLSGILGIEKKAVAESMERARNKPFVPMKLARDIKKEKAIEIEEMRLDFPGLIVTTRPLRNYIYKENMAHLLGYLGKISESELLRYRTYGYRMIDYVGKDGVEWFYNDYLRGTNGGLQIEVDSRGRQLRVLATKEPSAGRDLYLSVDIELQKFCDSIMNGKKGAIIAMESSTGAILAMVSRPNFDPNVFIAVNDKEVSRLLNDSEGFPLMNRAIAGTYPPGSIFKTVVATAALETGTIDDRSIFYCSGIHVVGNRIFHCWKEKGHGSQNVGQGIQNSCNSFFYQLGLVLGVERISEYASKFGLGSLLGIDLPGEKPGLVPTPSWKRRSLKASWFNGETANYSIGQGYLLITPLQALNLVNVFASGGMIVEPYVAARIENVRVRHLDPRQTGFKKTTVKSVKVALKNVVNAPRGTGIYARSEEIIISGKTGTAQNPHGKTHAWFTGFAPFKDPKITVVVFSEHGGKGGLDPARFAKKIIEEAGKLELL